MAKPLKLTEKDAKEILKHKPEPGRKTAKELAEEYDVSQATIRNVWRNNGLPPRKARSPRNESVDVRTMSKIAKRKGEDAAKVATEFNVKTAVVRRIWSTLG